MMQMRRGHHPRPGLPAVNLLSDAAFERLTTRRLRIRYLLAGVALVALLAATWAVQHARVAEARGLVAVVRGETTRLEAETQTLAPVRAFVAGVDLQAQTVETNMEAEIYFSEVLDGLRRASPPSVRLASVAVTTATAAEPPVAGAAEAVPVLSACPGPDPFNTREVVGCITLSGTASSRFEVGELVVNLGDDPLFVEPFVSITTSGDTAGVEFSGSVGLAREAYSKRYGQPAKIVAETVSP